MAAQEQPGILDRVSSHDPQLQHDLEEDEQAEDLILTPLSLELSSDKPWLTIEPIVFLLFFAVNLSSK